MMSRLAGFSKDRVSELFNFFKELLNTKLMLLESVYNIDQIALTTFLKNRKSDMEKWNIADVVNLKCEERNHYNHCLICQQYWLLCASYGDTQNVKSMWRLKTWGTTRIFICIQLREQLHQQRISFQQNIIHYCMYKRVFPILCLRSIDGNSVVHSWEPSAMNGPVTRFNKIFFFEQLWMSYICEIGLGNREQIKVFKVIFAVFLCATYFFIFVNNA